MKEPNVIIPIKNNRLYFLFRRGKIEHIKALYEEGEVYINTIDFIRTCDNNPERADVDDGILFRKFLGEAKITICDVGKNFDKDGVTMDTSNLVFKNDHKKKVTFIVCPGYIQSIYQVRGIIQRLTLSHLVNPLFLSINLKNSLIDYLTH